MTNGTDLLDFRLGELRKPTLIVWGSQDHLIPLEVGETLHQSIAGSTLTVLPGCGHLAPAECSRGAFALSQAVCGLARGCVSGCHT